MDIIFANVKAYIERTILDCSIAIDNGKIFKIGREASMPNADTKIDLKGLLTLPGLIDVHVHLRDEGKVRKEDFYTGTSAAAAGGITTVLDMPNNDPVTMSSESLRNRMEMAKDKILVNVGFYSEFPYHIDEIESIVKAGAVAFKLFMAEQVGGLNIEDNALLQEAFKAVSNLKKLVATHAEDRKLLYKIKDQLQRTGQEDLDAYLKAHSEEVEAKAIYHLLEIARQANMRIHFCHVTTELGLNTIIEGKKRGASATCETTPHNLLLTTKDLKLIGTTALTMPPLRDKHNVEALWEGIRNGSIDIVASDHAPHMPKEKETKDVWEAKAGIPGLETMLPLLLTEARKGRLSISDIVRLMAEKPAEIFELKDRGLLKTGNWADLTIIDSRKKGKIDASKFRSKAKFSPFDGWNIEGMPVKTVVNGQLVMDENEIISKTGIGAVLRRE